MNRRAVLGVILGVASLAAGGVSAHPLDEIGEVVVYDQKQRLEFGREKVKLTIDLTFYAMEKVKVWESVDINRDKEISLVEREKWMSLGQEASFLEITGTKVGFEAIGLTFPDYYEFFGTQPGRVKIEFEAAAYLNPGTGVIYHYLGRDRKLSEIELMVSGAGDLTHVSPEAVSLRVSEGETGEIAGLPAGDKVNDFLNKYVKGDELPVRLAVVALATAFAIGALHALTPGHGKAIVGGFLVGEKGTVWHAVSLGLIVTATHTASVFILGLGVLFLTEFFVPAKIVSGLSLVSGILVLTFGAVLLARRSLSLLQPHRHEEEHHHDHVSRRVGWRSLLALGVSGGMVPCVDALAILVVAVSLQKIFLGLLVLVFFSLGLAAALTGAGVVAVAAKGAVASRVGQLHGFEHLLGIVSAGVVTILGLAMVVKI